MNLLQEIYIVLKKERMVFLKQICSSLLITSLLCSHLGLARPDNEYRLRVAKNKGIITEEQYHFLTDPNMKKLAIEVKNLSSIDSSKGKKLISKIMKTSQKMASSQGKDVPSVSKKDINNALDQMFLPSNIKKVTNFAASDFLEGRNCRSTTANFAKRNLPLKNNLPSFEDEDQILSSNVINQSFASVFKASNVSDLKNKLASNIKSLRVNYKEEVNSNSRYVVCNKRSLMQDAVALKSSFENIMTKDMAKELRLVNLPPKQSFKTQFLSFFGVEKKQIASRNIADISDRARITFNILVAIIVMVLFLIAPSFLGVLGLILILLTLSLIVSILFFDVSVNIDTVNHNYQLKIHSKTYSMKNTMQSISKIFKNLFSIIEIIE